MIKIDLTLDEVNTLLVLLGDLPTKTGVFPLMMNIKAQATTQVQEQEQKPAEQNSAE